MKIKRRDFLKGLAGSAVLAMAPPAIAASSEKNRLPGALGILYDSTLCVGCQACMVACKKANNMPMEFSGPQRSQNLQLMGLKNQAWKIRRRRAIHPYDLPDAEILLFSRCRELTSTRSR